jgi:D-aminopeptidase
VPGVGVGHATVWRDEPDPPAGRGTARTGVTAIVPFEPESLFRARVPAGAAVLNGAGEAIGITSIDEWGVLETPIFLTSSMAIGRVYDAAVALLVDRIPEAGLDDALMPVVAECDDGRLNGSRLVQVDVGDVREALRHAAGQGQSRATGRDRAPAASGAVGAGTGMVAFELKGGIGQASRLVQPSDRRHAEAPSGHADAPSRARVTGATAAEQAAPGTSATYTLGALALANFGRLERLTVDGVRVGEALRAAGWPAAGTIAGASGSGALVRRPVGAGPTSTEGEARERGSCVVVLATDAPLLPHQLRRLARRAGLGLARTGSTAGHGSGEIFLAFSTGLRIPRAAEAPLLDVRYVNDEHLDPFFAAAVEATEAAVVDALFSADTVIGRAGTEVPGLPVEATLALLEAAGRLSRVRAAPGDGLAAHGSAADDITATHIAAGRGPA